MQTHLLYLRLNSFSDLLMLVLLCVLALLPCLSMWVDWVPPWWDDGDVLQIDHDDCHDALRRLRDVVDLISLQKQGFSLFILFHARCFMRFCMILAVCYVQHIQTPVFTAKRDEQGLWSSSVSKRDRNWRVFQNQSADHSKRRPSTYIQHSRIQPDPTKSSCHVSCHRS